MAATPKAPGGQEWPLDIVACPSGRLDFGQVRVSSGQNSSQAMSAFVLHTAAARSTSVSRAVRPRRRYAGATVEGRGRMSTALVMLAVGTGVVVIVVAAAVVLVVLIVAVSMRGRQQRGAQQRGEARRDVDEAREREGRQRDRDNARKGREDVEPDR
jgi:uncharacterized membrane protein